MRRNSSLEGYHPTLPEAGLNRGGGAIFCICKQSAVLSHKKIWQQGSTQLTPLFDFGSFLFVFKEETRENQDSTRYNVHRFYTPLALSNKRTRVPVYLLRGEGMLGAMQLKPFQMLKEKFCVVNHAILEWTKHFTCQMHIQI